MNQQVITASDTALTTKVLVRAIRTVRDEIASFILVDAA